MNISFNLSNITVEALILFTFINLIYVALNTVKSILTIKSTKVSAALASAITFAYYTIVLKMVQNYALEISLIGTLLSNLIATPISMTIAEFIRQRGVVCWKVTTHSKEKFNKLRDYCIEQDLGWNWEPAYTESTKKPTYYKFTIYTKNRDIDKQLSEKFEKFGITHFKKEED